MTEYLVFTSELQAQASINTINDCAGFPNQNTLTWGTPLPFYNSPNTDDVIAGWAILILPEIYPCLTAEQMLLKNTLAPEYTFTPKNYPNY